MLAQLRRALVLSGFVLLVACSAWAQTTTLEGDVKDQNGQPLKGAVIKLDRTDIKGHYQVKTDKKGHWLYTGLPFGKYDVSCEVDGKAMDKVSGVQSKYGESVPVNFDLSKTEAAAGSDDSGECEWGTDSGAAARHDEGAEGAIRGAAEAANGGHEEEQGPERCV